MAAAGNIMTNSTDFAILKMTQTTESTDSTTEVSDKKGNMHIDAITLQFVIGLAMCLLNGVCATAIIRGKLHRDENKFIFMASLAVADSILGCTLLMTAITHLLQQGNSAVFYASHIALEAIIAADVLCLCLLTADQFMRIELHMRYPVYATFRNACFALAGVVALCSAQVAVAIGVSYQRVDDMFNYFKFPLWFHMYNLVLYFVGPLVAIICMHTRLFYISWTQMKKLAELIPAIHRTKHRGDINAMKSIANPQVHLNRHEENSHRHLGKSATTGHRHKAVAHEVCPCGHNDSFQARRQWKSVVTISVLVGVLLLTWLPGNTVMILLVFKPGHATESTSAFKLIEYTSILYYVNPLLNPFIYIARVPEVQKQIRKMMTFSCR